MVSDFVVPLFKLFVLEYIFMTILTDFLDSCWNRIQSLFSFCSTPRMCRRSLKGWRWTCVASFFWSLKANRISSALLKLALMRLTLLPIWRRYITYINAHTRFDWNVCSTDFVQSKISEKLCPVASHMFPFIFQVNKGVTRINLVDFANQLDAQADQLVRFIFGLKNYSIFFRY